MEKIIYICDRCGREKDSDRSYWESIYHRLLYKRDKTLLCPKCYEAFQTFIGNHPTGITYLT